MSTHYVTVNISPNHHTPLLAEALYTPMITHNLVSVHDLARRYGPVHFTAAHAFVIDTSPVPPRFKSTTLWRPTKLSYIFHPCMAVGACASRSILPCLHIQSPIGTKITINQQYKSISTLHKGRWTLPQAKQINKQDLPLLTKIPLQQFPSSQRHKYPPTVSKKQLTSLSISLSATASNTKLTRPLTKELKIKQQLQRLPTNPHLLPPSLNKAVHWHLALNYCPYHRLISIKEHNPYQSSMKSVFHTHIPFHCASCIIVK